MEKSTKRSNKSEQHVLLEEILLLPLQIQVHQQRNKVKFLSGAICSVTSSPLHQSVSLHHQSGFNFSGTVPPVKQFQGRTWADGTGDKFVGCLTFYKLYTNLHLNNKPIFLDAKQEAD